MKTLFLLTNAHTGMETRQRDKFLVTHANTERFKMSAIPYMQRLLNSEYRKQENTGEGSD